VSLSIQETRTNARRRGARSGSLEEAGIAQQAGPHALAIVQTAAAQRQMPRGIAGHADHGVEPLPSIEVLSCSREDGDTRGG
jgi:hypothetical protein